MWRRDLQRAFERTGARAPGATVGWAIVVVLAAIFVGTWFEFRSGDGSSEGVLATLPIAEAVSGPTVAPLSNAAEDVSTTSPDVGPGSSVTDLDRTVDLAAATVVLAAEVTTTAPSTTAPPTTRPTASSTTAAPAPTTTAATISNTAAPTTAVPTTAVPTTAVTLPTSISTTTVPTTAAPTTTTLPSTDTTQVRSAAAVVSDQYQVESGKGEKLKVLDNDGDRDLLDGRTLVIVSNPSHADKVRVHKDHIHYESDDDYEGTDSLQYRVCTYDGACGVATVTIRVVDD